MIDITGIVESVGNTSSAGNLKAGSVSISIYFII